jgi:hypothetical protein
MKVKKIITLGLLCATGIVEVENTCDASGQRNTGQGRRPPTLTLPSRPSTPDPQLETPRPNRNASCFGPAAFLFCAAGFLHQFYMYNNGGGLGVLCATAISSVAVAAGAYLFFRNRW